MELLDDFASNALYSNGGEAPARLGWAQWKLAPQLLAVCFMDVQWRHGALGPFQEAPFFSEDIWMYPYQRTPYGKSQALYSGYLWVIIPKNP